MTARLLAIFLVMGHPLLFGIYFCLAGMFEGRGELLTSLLAEVIAAVLTLGMIMYALPKLKMLRFGGPERYEKAVVFGAFVLCMVLAFISLLNADSSGLFSKGGSRLDLYFASDWFRRFVTFSYIPLATACYYSMKALLSPVYRNQRLVFVAFLFSLLFYSLVGGSKGAAVLLIAAALPFVFGLRPLPIMKIGLALLAVAVVYLALFFALTTDSKVSLLTIVMRFYLSIDMSILLTGGQGTAELTADQLGDVWVEIFRNLGSLGVRISADPIGVLVYKYTMETVPTVGANCRYASLLLLYPDRLDFLLLYPILVFFVALLLVDVFKSLGLARGALVIVPCFAFQSLQDVYWFTGNFLPIVFAFSIVQIGKVISRGFASRYRYSA